MVSLKELTIAVLRGGPSSERDISLLSGEAVLNSLRRQNYKTVDIIVPDSQDLEFLENWLLSQLVTHGIDVCFIALHGWFGEDGKIQDILERAGYRYTGSGPEASRLAMDKIASRKIFELNGIPVPRYKIYDRVSDFLPQDFQFPIIVKPSSQGSSVGLNKVDEPSDFIPLLSEALKYDGRAIVEEFISGPELTVGILEEKPLPVIRIQSHLGIYNYKAKYTPGFTDYILPADIPEQITKKAQRYALQAHDILGCSGFSRVDMLYSLKDHEIYVLEVNTIPGLTTSSLLPKAAKFIGIDFDKLVETMLKSAFKDEKYVCQSRKTEKAS
jgi:D-alanine-D-alanine ligase